MAKAKPSDGNKKWIISVIVIAAVVVLFLGLSASTRQALFGQVIQTGDDETMYGQDTGSSGGSSSSGSSLPPELGCTVILTNPAAEAYAWWRFDNSNVNYVDNWGQAYPPAAGTSWIVGTPAYGTGKAGQAFNFEGSNYISIPDAPWQDATGTLSIDAWIYPKKKANMQIIRKHDGTNGYNLVTTSGGNIKFWINGIYARSKDTYKVNAWNHIAVVYYPGNTIKIFINGKESEIYTLEMGTVPASIGTNNQPLKIGGGVSKQNFKGYLDEVTIYLNKALVLKDAQRLVAVGNDPNGGKGKCSIQPLSGGNTRAAAGCVPVPAGLTGWTTMDWQGNYLDSVGNLREARYPNRYYPLLKENGEASHYYGSGDGKWPIPPPSLYYDQGKVGKALVGITPFWHENVGSLYDFILVGKNFEGAAWVGGLPGPLTLEAWIKPNELKTSNIVANYLYQGQTDTEFDPSVMKGYLLRTLSNGKIRFYINNVYLDSTNTGWYGDQNTYDWGHIAAVYVPGQSMRIYINGVLKGERTTGVPSSILYGNEIGNSEVWIGGIKTLGSPYIYPTHFNGKLDEVSIYNTAVSQQEIQAIYNAGSAGKCPLGITLEQAAASEEAAGYQQFILPEGTDLEALGTAVGIVSGGGGDVVPTGETGETLPSTQGVSPTSTEGLTMPAPSCTSNLVSWWQGEVNGQDYAGLNPAGSSSKVSYDLTTKKGGVYSFSFNGVDDMLAMSDSASLDVTGVLTLETWIYPVQQKTMQVIRKHDGSNGYNLAMESNGKINFWINLAPVVSTSSYPLNQWTHVAAVYVPGQSMKIYINGVLDVERTASVPAAIGANNANLYLGGGFSTQNYVGLLDDVALYNKALSAAEVYLLANQPETNRCTPPAPGACTGTAPANTQFCLGDDLGLSADTARVLVDSCNAASTAKCEYTCALGYYKSGASCMAYQCTNPTDATIPGNAQLCSGDDVLLSANTPRMLVDFCTNAVKCEYACEQYSHKVGNFCTPFQCTGTTPANSQFCTGDAQNLVIDTGIRLVTACTTAKKCEAICASTHYRKDALTCTAYQQCTGTTPANALVCSSGSDEQQVKLSTVRTLVGAQSKCTTKKKCEYYCSSGTTKSGNQCI